MQGTASRNTMRRNPLRYFLRAAAPEKRPAGAGHDMDWIERNKFALSILAALSFLAAALVLFVFRDGPRRVTAWQVGLAVTPWLVFAAAIFPLIYLAWFRRTGSGAMRTVALVFFWLLVAAWVFIFAGIYGVFVFGFWRW
jgi:hypothetical protein